MKSIKEIEKLSWKKALVRLDLNVPIKDGKVVDDFRIKKCLPTIEFLHKKGATVVILAHLGETGKESLAPVALRLKKYIPTLQFISSPILSDETENEIKKLKKGSIVLLQNVRMEPGEKNNAPSFARALSRYGDFYVNDAFSVCHRAHASVIGITKYLDGYAGLQLIEEIKNLSLAFNPEHPFLFMLGGAKFETKIPLIKKFVRDADYTFVSGALSSNFFRAKGFEIGKSLIDTADHFQIDSLVKQKSFLLPIDLEVAIGNKHRFVKPDEVSAEETIVDIGSKTVELLKSMIEKSKFILWNGPLGKYEDGFGGATEEILKFISKTKVKNVIGGGDTVALISKLKLEDKLGFISTGGGATLEFLAKGTLPGIKVLK
jgi:phosphoglycerate kinase